MSPLRDALRSFLRVWTVGTVMLFIPGLFGWINGVTDWARSEGSTPFPDAHGLAFIFVAAITSSFVAAGAAILRYVENLAGGSLLPRPAGTTVPTRRRADRGAAEGGLLVRVLVLVVVVLLILWLVARLL